MFSLVPSHRPSACYDVHTDYLETPRLLTNSTGATVWTSRHEAFGKAYTATDPDGDSTHVTFPLRFPGQYEDAETGLHYNRHRYYDPQIGRYLSVDPVRQHAMFPHNGVSTLLATPEPPPLPADLLQDLGTTVFADRDNPYRYAHSNPGVLIDPTGEFWNFVAGCLVGGLIGAVFMTGLAGVETSTESLTKRVVTGCSSEQVQKTTNLKQNVTGAALAGAIAGCVTGAIVASGLGAAAAATKAVETIAPGPAMVAGLLPAAAGKGVYDGVTACCED